MMSLPGGACDVTDAAEEKSLRATASGVGDWRMQALMRYELIAVSGRGRAPVMSLLALPRRGTETSRQR